MNQQAQFGELLEKAIELDRGPSRPEFPGQFVNVCEQLLARYKADPTVPDLPIETEVTRIGEVVTAYRVKHTLDLGFPWEDKNGWMNIVVSFANVREGHVDHRNDLAPGGWIVSTYADTLVAINTVFIGIGAAHLVTRF